MNSNVDIEELFRRISSPQTTERFKTLRFATPEDLASTFKPGLTESSSGEINEKASSFPKDT